MANISTHLEDCPKCGSDDLEIWHSHYCQAFFVICKSCKHEEGRTAHEYEAVSAWNDAALSTQPTEPQP